MTTAPVPPFSARNRSETRLIDDDFPASARTGLLHLLNDAIERGFVSGWHTVAKELRRLTRAAPQQYDSKRIDSMQQARNDVETYLQGLEWARVYDLCERIHNSLAEGSMYQANFLETITITKTESQQFVAEEMQRLFDEENLGYEFRDGLVQRRGKHHTLAQINKAEKVLVDNRLHAARQHYSKALRHFRDREKPDFENAVKEAVCAVEAAAKELFPDAKANTLGDFIKWASNTTRGQLMPPSISQTFTGLYAFRSSGQGVSHGGATGGHVTLELCEYVLGIAASQIVLLVDLSTSVDEPPF